MNSLSQPNTKNTEPQSLIQKDEDECVLISEKKEDKIDDEMLTDDKYTSPPKFLNKKRNCLLSSAPLNQLEPQEIIKETEKISAQAYKSKGRERGKKTIKKESDQPTSNCHYCREVVLINKMLICSNELCKESYCFNCVKTHYISFVGKTPISSLKRNSNNNKWNCFKCNLKCFCLRCLPLSKKKIKKLTPHEVFILPSVNVHKGNKQTATFKTELVTKEQEQDSSNSNEFDCQILKLKDEALIQSLYNYTKPTVNNRSVADNKATKNKKKKKNRKKKKQNSKSEAHSPQVEIEEIKIQDEKIQQLIRQCEGYFFEQSKRKSFFKKTCLFCKGQCFNTNELLYFRYLKDFLQYVNYLFTYQPIIIYNKEITNDNKEVLFNALKELNGSKNKDDWHFSQPKVLCKGCLMTIINESNGIDKFRKYLMDEKDKKRDNNSDKEKELEQENDIKMQTKEINEQIERDIQQSKRKNKVIQIANSNVFNKVFNKNQDQLQLKSSYVIQLPIESNRNNVNQQQQQPQEQTEEDQSGYRNSISTLNYQIPIFIPEIFPQYFNSLLNDIVSSCNQLINDIHSINQQYRSGILTLETVSSYYLMIEKIIRRNNTKEQEINQIMFNCKTILFSFLNYCDNICSMNQNSDKVLFGYLRKIRENFEYEFRVYNELMNKVLQGLEICRKLGYEYLEDMKIQYNILECIASIK